MTEIALDDYRLLGRSGLRVSPLALGGLSFGTDWGFGMDKATTHSVLDAYVDRGGNFVDTASGYTNGSSERIIGQYAKHKRDRLVIATKYSIAMHLGDPNSGGNHRKSMMASVEGSLKRLGTECIDLLYLHIWDQRTHAEEVVRGLDDLVRQGKLLYAAISDTPAWQISRMQTIAELRGWTPLAALQIEYSLIERTVERDLIPMANELGLGVVTWAALGSGLLAGKYTRRHSELGLGAVEHSMRKNVLQGMGKINERNLDIADEVMAIALEIDKKPAQVALAWVLANPTITSAIIGVRTMAQFEDNLGALTLILDANHRKRLDDISRISLGFPHDLMNDRTTLKSIFGGTKVAYRS